MVQWLGPLTFTVKEVGLIPGQVTKIPQATWYGQKTNKTSWKCYMTYILFCVEFGLSLCMVMLFSLNNYLVKTNFVSPNFHKVDSERHIYIIKNKLNMILMLFYENIYWKSRFSFSWTWSDIFLDCASAIRYIY